MALTSDDVSPERSRAMVTTSDDDPLWRTASDDVPPVMPSAYGDRL
jgi:hypothetical protein